MTHTFKCNLFIRDFADFGADFGDVVTEMEKYD